MGRRVDATNSNLHLCQQISGLGRFQGIVQESTGFLKQRPAACKAHATAA